MSYSIDANILIYASNSGSEHHQVALNFLQECADNPDLMCLTWPVLMAYQRIATHASIFDHPLSSDAAWQNIERLLVMPRVRMITEESGFAEDYRKLTIHLNIRGNLVPDAHIATLLQQHGVKRIYTADSDFRKFDFLQVVNPFV